MSEPIKIVIEITALIAAILASLAALISGWSAFLNYRLSSQLRDEIKSDETLIVSKLVHPNLEVMAHRHCVIKCNLFNKSKRKAHVNKVKVYSRKNNLLEITWSNKIDNFGNPQNPCELIGIIDMEELFVRQNNGEWIESCIIEIFHSFSTQPIVVAFDPDSMEDYKNTIF